MLRIHLQNQIKAYMARRPVPGALPAISCMDCTYAAAILLYSASLSSDVPWFTSAASTTGHLIQTPQYYI